MNLLYGEVLKVFDIGGSPSAQMRVGRVLKNISLAVVADAVPGDTVLVCDGLAIGMVQNERKDIHVPGNSR